MIDFFIFPYNNDILEIVVEVVMNIFNINVIDVVIVLMILCAGVVGLKRGVFKELVMTVGYLFLFVIAFLLKNPIADFLSMNLPFFKFGGNFEGLVSLNIILYQLIAFIIIFAILGVVFNIVLTITKALEKLLDFTIILGAISKLLGFVVGLIEGYILMYIVCLFLCCPLFNQTVVAESKLKDRILNETPVLSQFSKGITKTVEEVVALSNSDLTKDKDEFNRETVDIMLRHKVVTVEYMDKLVAKGKMDVPGLGAVIDKYR